MKRYGQASDQHGTGVELWCALIYAQDIGLTLRLFGAMDEEQFSNVLQDARIERLHHAPSCETVPGGNLSTMGILHEPAMCGMGGTDRSPVQHQDHAHILYLETKVRAIHNASADMPSTRAETSMYVVAVPLALARAR